jgi:hypothetical protein
MLRNLSESDSELSLSQFMFSYFDATLESLKRAFLPASNPRLRPLL